MPAALGLTSRYPSIDHVPRQKAAQRSTVVRLHELAKPTLALVEGAAVGAGLGLALACDLRYAGTFAILRTGFGRLGLAGDFGCTWFLRRLAGPARALELLYFSEPLTAARAQELGLVTEAVDDAQLRGRVMRLARCLADAPQEALRAMLKLREVEARLEDRRLTSDHY